MYIDLGDTVRRAWKTDPKHQFQVGTIAEVYEAGSEKHELGHDVAWHVARGYSFRRTQGSSCTRQSRLNQRVILLFRRVTLFA